MRVVLDISLQWTLIKQIKEKVSALSHIFHKLVTTSWLLFNLYVIDLVYEKSFIELSQYFTWVLTIH